MNLFKCLSIFFSILYLSIFCTFSPMIYAEEDINYIKVNKTFLKKSHWNFKLKEVSRNNDLVKISIRYTNKGTYRRPIFLAQGGTAVGTGLNTKKGFDFAVNQNGNFSK